MLNTNKELLLADFLKAVSIPEDVPLRPAGIYPARSVASRVTECCRGRNKLVFLIYCVLVIKDSPLMW
jgi:hypothetical protein